VVVLRLQDRQPPRQQTLEEVSDTIRETLRQEKAAARALEIATAMEQAVADGATLASVAEQHGARFEALGWVKRDARNLGLPVVNTVFRMPHPTGGVSVAHADTPTGDVAVLAVTGVRDGKLETLSEAERDALRQQLHELAGARDFQAFLGGLRQTASIEIFEEYLFR
jgi:peptidyl-prolyl cis-trans isomerase D